MRGHQPILAMRRRGLRPAYVTLSDLPPSAWAKWPSMHRYPDVCIDADDSPDLLDLRFVVGLPVVVEIDSETRMRRLVLAAEKAGASRVYGFAVGVPAICTEGDQSWRS